MHVRDGVQLPPPPAASPARSSAWETSLRVPGVRAIHYVVVRGGLVEPLCSSWIESTDWTVVPAAASCPRCLSRMGAAALASMTGPRGA